SPPVSSSQSAYTSRGTSSSGCSRISCNSASPASMSVPSAPWAPRQHSKIRPAPPTRLRHPLCYSHSHARRQKAKVAVHPAFRHSPLRRRLLMTVKQITAAVGIFDDARSAQQAVRALKETGFGDDEIGVLAPHDEGVHRGTHAADGAVVGVAA